MQYTATGITDLIWGCDGVPSPLPPTKGFPAGRIKFKFRPKSVGMAFVRVSPNETRKYYVRLKDGYLQPAWEMGANIIP